MKKALFLLVFAGVFAYCNPSQDVDSTMTDTSAMGNMMTDTMGTNMPDTTSPAMPDPNAPAMPDTTRP